MYEQDAARQLLVQPPPPEGTAHATGPAGLLGGILGAIAAGAVSGGMGAPEGFALGSGIGSGVGATVDSLDGADAKGAASGGDTAGKMQDAAKALLKNRSADADVGTGT